MEQLLPKPEKAAMVSFTRAQLGNEIPLQLITGINSYLESIMKVKYMNITIKFHLDR